MAGAEANPTAARPGKRSLLTRDEPALWYAAAEALPPLPENGAGGPPADEVLVEAKRAEAEAAMERESELFEADMGRKSGQDARWLQTVRRSGTTADKVAAHSLVIQVRSCRRQGQLCTGVAICRSISPRQEVERSGSYLLSASHPLAAFVLV